MKRVLQRFILSLLFLSVIDLAHAGFTPTFNNGVVKYAPATVSADQKVWANAWQAKIGGAFNPAVNLFGATAPYDYVNSARFAMSLLDEGDPAEQTKAFNIISALLAIQDVNGQWNGAWEDFIGVILIDIYTHHGSKFSVSVLDSMETAIIRSATKCQSENTRVEYTNISLMETNCAFLASQIFDIPSMKIFAQNKFEEIYYYNMAQGTFSEYNSNNYTPVFLDDLMRMEQYMVRQTDLDKITDLNRLAWKMIGEHWHKPSGQWVGPISRAYFTRTDKLYGNWYGVLYVASGGLIDYGDRFNQFDVKLDYHIPTDILNTYFINPVYPAMVVDQFRAFEKDGPQTVATNYMTSNFSFSSYDWSSCWEQRRFCVSYWGTKLSPRYLAVRFLHDNRDFGAAIFNSKQNKNSVLAGINIATNFGDTHISTDNINGDITATDLRLRFELGTPSSVSSITLPTNRFDPFTFITNGMTIKIHLFSAGFSGYPDGYWVKGSNSTTAWVDYVVYSGSSTTINFNAMADASLGFTLSASALSSEIPTASNATSTITSGVMTANWNGMTLQMPVKPAPITKLAVTSVSIAPATVSLRKNEAIQLKAEIIPSKATNQMVTWSSSNPTVATVNRLGLVSAIGLGSTTITAITQDGNRMATRSVLVSDYTWTGASNTNWSLHSNWLDSVPPPAAVDILIPSGLSRYPVLNRNDTIGKCKLQAGASMDINGYTLHIKDSVLGTGTFIGSAQSNLVLNGSGTIYLSQLSNGNSNALNSIIINTTGRITLGNSLQVTKQVKVTAGILASSGNLTLVASSNGIARIPTLGGTITGNVITQLYIPAKGARKYSFIGSSVAQPISNAWQKQMYITGSGSGGAVCGSTNGNGGTTDRFNSNGFDKTPTDTPSMFDYNAIQINGTRWLTIPNTINTNLTPGKGYRLNIRGDRNASTCLDQLSSITPTAPTAVVLNATGVLTQGDLTINLNDTNKHLYTLLANPYPNQISFAALKASNTTINNKLWTYSPYGNGNYTTFSNGLVNNPAAGYNGTNADYIAIGQAFFVEANKTGTSLTFKESHKIDSLVPNFQYFGFNNLQVLRLGFYDTANIKLDECALRYNTFGSKNYNEEWDAIALGGGNQSLTSTKDAYSLAIATRSLTNSTDTIHLNVSSNKVGVFNLQIQEITGFDASTQYQLKDNYLGKTQSIDLNKGYQFTITNDTASFGGNRFVLLIGKSTPLPIVFSYINCKRENSKAVINWEVNEEKEISHFIVERQIGDNSFKSIGTVKQRGAANVGYEFIDAELPSYGLFFYRVVAIEKNGNKVFSKTVSLNNPSITSVETSIYPNPAKDRLYLAGKGIVSVAIVDELGRVVVSKKLNGFVNTSMDVSALIKGCYVVLIETMSGNWERKKLLKD